MSCGARRNYAAQSANLIVLYRRLYVARGSAYRIDVNSTKILFHLRSWLQLVIGKIRERSMIINVRRWNQLRQTCFCYSELNDISILFFLLFPLRGINVLSFWNARICNTRLWNYRTDPITKMYLRIVVIFLFSLWSSEQSLKLQISTLYLNHCAISGTNYCKKRKRKKAVVKSFQI